MSDSLLSDFIGGTIPVGLAKLSTTILGFLATVLVVRVVSEEELGAFVLLQVVNALLTRVSDFGLGLSIAKFITSTDDKQHRRKLIHTVLYFRILTVLFVGLAALAARPALSALFGSSLPFDLVMFLPLLCFAQSLGELLRSVLQGLFLFNKDAMAEFIANVSNLFLVLLFILVLDQGVLGLVSAKVISMALACGFAYFAIPIERKLEFHLGLLRELLKFGFPLHINSILTFAFLRIDTLMIGGLLGPAEIAYYEIARKIPESLGGFYEAFRKVFFPFISRLFAHGEHKAAAQMLNHSTRLLSFVSILGALVALVFGEEIISLAFSEKYLPSVPVFVLLMIGLNLSLIDYTLGYSLVAAGDSSKPAFINVVHTAVSLLGNLILIPIFGTVGGALAVLAGFSATNPLNVLFLRRRRVDARVMRYLKPILVFGACWLLVLVLRPVTFLQRASVVAAFLVACGFLSIVTVEDLTVVSRETKTALAKALVKVQSWHTGT